MCFLNFFYLHTIEMSKIETKGKIHSVSPKHNRKLSYSLEDSLSPSLSFLSAIPLFYPHTNPHIRTPFPALISTC